MTAKEIMNLYTSFQKLTNYDMDLDSASTILDNIDALSNPYKIIEKKRNEIIQKYAERNENGEISTNDNGMVFIDKNHLEDCNFELGAVFNEETEVEIKPIKKSSLEKVKLSPNDLSVLRQYFVKE